MKKIVFIGIYMLLLVSCKTYLDKNNNNIDNEAFYLEYYEDYNKLVYKPTVGVIMDTEKHNKQHYETKIPKKIINWRIINGVFYLEFGSNQIIIIDAGYSKPERRKQEWSLSDISSDLINKYMYRYDKNFEEDVKPKKKKTTKLYSDGKTKIILYNTNSNEFNNYHSLLKSFKYIN